MNAADFRMVLDELGIVIERHAAEQVEPGCDLVVDIDVPEIAFPFVVFGIGVAIPIGVVVIRHLERCGVGVGAPQPVPGFVFVLVEIVGFLLFQVDIGGPPFAEVQHRVLLRETGKTVAADTGDVGVVERGAEGYVVGEIMGAAKGEQVFGDRVIGKDTLVFATRIASFEGSILGTGAGVDAGGRRHGSDEEIRSVVMRGGLPGCRLAIVGVAGREGVPVIDQFARIISRTGGGVDVGLHDVYVPAVAVEDGLVIKAIVRALRAVALAVFGLIGRQRGLVGRAYGHAAGDRYVRTFFAVAFFCRDEDHAVGRAGAIEGRSGGAFEHAHGFDVFGVDVGDRVAEVEAILALVGIVIRDAIHHEEGLVGLG